MKPFSPNLPCIGPKPLSQASYRPNPNPPYLLHRMSLKSKPTTSKSHHLITPLVDDPRTKTAISGARRMKDSSFLFSAWEHRMNLITKGVYAKRKSLIRSPKQMLSSLTFVGFPNPQRGVSMNGDRKKRDLLTLTGGMNSANLKNLVDYKETRENHFYALKIGDDSKFRNYKYKKPNGLFEYIFKKETVKTSNKNWLPTKELENCIENLRGAKQTEAFNKVANELEEMMPAQDSKPETRGKPKVFKDDFPEIMSEILEYLENTTELEPREIPSEEKNQENEKMITNDKIDVFIKSGLCKGPWMLKEFSYLWQISKKALAFLEKMKRPQARLADSVSKGKNLLLIVVKMKFSGFEGRNRLINERVLLAMDLNPMKPLSLISIEKYFKLVRLSYICDNSPEELIDFAVRYFRVSHENQVEKEEFFRVLKTLTQQIDDMMEENTRQKRKSLFENFLENYYITGVLKKEESFVDFKRFAEVYKGYQMNIYDLVDLIFGRV